MRLFDYDWQFGANDWCRKSIGLFDSKQLGFVGKSEFYKNVAAAQIEFLADVGAVSFDRAVTDEKLIGDFFAGFVFGNEFENAAFGRREVFDAGFFLS